MENIIIIGILVVMILVGAHSTIKHFKGQGGCCGGGSSVKVKKKKLKNVIAQKTIIIEGMTCDHCKNRVERFLNEMPGVSATVNLKKKQALVSMEREVSEEELRKVIEKAGYEVVEIK
ncbi:MAG: heavy-metal-associated domain-containing protein [Lachnospiraceae bacterium]|nr:heavy-metal-associated domain-containing protein [Lachnospiraceae bacterium]